MHYYHKQMTDRLHHSHSAKINGGTATAATNHNPVPAPPEKSHNRHPYRPQPSHHSRRDRRSRRSCFCCCFFWSILFIILLLLLTGIAGAVVYALYRPQRPTFSFTSLKISQFNLTTFSDDSTRLTSKLNLTLSSTNPNKKLDFIYDPIQITALASSQEVEIGNGSFKSFTSNPKNITYIHTTLYSDSQVLDADSVNSLRSKKKSGLPVKIIMDTRVTVKADNLRSKKVGIRIKCQGIHTTIPQGKSVAVASVSKAKCKVDLRIKIWKWTF